MPRHRLGTLQSINQHPGLLKAAVFGANDGIITTFAVVAGVAGAQLSPSTVIIMGIANLIGDGISMGVGDFLGERTEVELQEQRTGKKSHRKIWLTGWVTFVSFVIAGALPLLPYWVEAAGLHLTHQQQFIASVFATAFALFFVGSLRTLIIHRPWWKNGLEVLGVGSLAACAAYLFGALVKHLIS